MLKRKLPDNGFIFGEFWANCTKPYLWRQCTGASATAPNAHDAYWICGPDCRSAKRMGILELAQFFSAICWHSEAHSKSGASGAENYGKSITGYTPREGQSNK